MAEWTGAYDLDRARLGGDHPDTLTSASNLAADLRRLGDLDAATALEDDVAQRRRSGQVGSPGQAQ